MKNEPAENRLRQQEGDANADCKNPLDEGEKMGCKMTNVKVCTFLEKKNGIGTVEVFLEVQDEREEPERKKETCQRKMHYLHAFLKDKEGAVKDAIFPLPVEREMSFCLCVEHPILWNAEECGYYDLILEIREGEETDTEKCRCVVENRKAAFWKWEILDGETCLNGKPIVFRGEKWPSKLIDPEKRRQFLANVKKEHKNTIFVENGANDEELTQLCIGYGVYLVEEGVHMESGKVLAQLDQEREENGGKPDFRLQVVQTGVLIENQSIFANASDYVLCYEVANEAGYEKRGELCAEVPAGGSRFVEVPFALPEEAGAYYYRAALCLKKDCAWEKRGYEIASAETLISNFYKR